MRPANDPNFTDSLKPLPLFFRASLRIVLTMDGMLGLVHIDDQGNARLSKWGYLVTALAFVLAGAIAVGVVRTLQG